VDSAARGVSPLGFEHEARMESQSIRIQLPYPWSPGDQGYIASVAEFPTMQSSPEATAQAALHSLMARVAQRVHQLDVDAQPRLLTLAQSWFGSEAPPHSIRFKTVTPCATVLSIKVSSRRSVGVPQRLMGMHRRSPVSSRRCPSDTKSFTADRPASQKAYTVVPDTGKVISGS
jgi:hypothetical protein